MMNATPGWMEHVPQVPLAWLLEPEDPAVRACALAELWFGRQPDDVRHLLAVTVSEGIGVGLLLNGQLGALAQQWELTRFLPRNRRVPEELNGADDGRLTMDAIGDAAPLVMADCLVSWNRFCTISAPRLWSR